MSKIPGILKGYSVLKNIFEIDNYNAALRWYTVSVFEIRAGPLPQDQQLCSKTSSILCLLVLGTGS